ncbi:class I SAM-dependent methyltransferase [Actibacterium pelagium]|uniref:Methyltransferase type 12 domain-containing protein n=1 Tax=Actibacterium pelagium TaxID=2029103 RepID=A0A917EH83_9RHOB|nr:class I SAM-dependent methyltransferase [Actibacterium pelagium]GGE39526.1 hypothetical protein GCM10011517_04030 [Actibacterium pelagium]
MVSVKEQYEAFPYPERDPKDERKRLITGSPSNPVEMDHFLWAGRRDWSKPLRVLVAGGGTGDGLIQLAHYMSAAKRPYQITYVDLSSASRAIAEARAKERGLSSITFHTGSLLGAAEYGQFDYIDCCGVLHHLPDPDAGFTALRSALAPGGGLGFMVYAPFGRSGVYPLQEAFGALFADLAPKERLREAKKVFAKLPDGHPFKRNPHLGDHQRSDAGFYDLLLHGQDQAYDVRELVETLERTGWALSSFATPALYDPSDLAPIPDEMSEVDRMSVAERLRGSIRLHVAYAVAEGETEARIAKGRSPDLIPHLMGVNAAKLARAVAAGKSIPVTLAGERKLLTLPKEGASLIAGINGRRTLSQIAQSAGLDQLGFGMTWQKLAKPLTQHGVLLYSNFLR